MSEYRPFEEIQNKVRPGDRVEFYDDLTRENSDGGFYRGIVESVDPQARYQHLRLVVSPERRDCGPHWGNVSIKILTPHQKLVPGYYPKRPTTNLSKTLKKLPAAAKPAEPARSTATRTATDAERRNLSPGYSFMSDLVDARAVAEGDTVEYRNHHLDGEISTGIVVRLTDGYSSTRVRVTSGRAGACWGTPCHVRVLERLPPPPCYMSAVELIASGLRIGDEVQLGPGHANFTGALGIVTVIDSNPPEGHENTRILVRTQSGLGSAWGTFNLGLRRRAADIEHYDEEGF